uniref:PID domain-containing protein n=1 Tax=Otus sunia TaxID=257818 RepID=A0A8C8B1M3_9STRI
MQSISFASGGDTDTTDYVAYVAKDPINQRACHILECCEGLAQSVISTVGQAFELRFKQYLVGGGPVLGAEESAWGEDEEVAEHDYYNSIPGKEPPPGGLIDSRLQHAGLCSGEGAAVLGPGGTIPSLPGHGCSVLPGSGCNPGSCCHRLACPCPHLHAPVSDTVPTPWLWQGRSRMP